MTNDVSTPEVRYFKAHGIYTKWISLDEGHQYQFDEVGLEEVTRSGCLTKGKGTHFAILSETGWCVSRDAYDFSESSLLSVRNGSVENLDKKTVLAVIDLGITVDEDSDFCEDWVEHLEDVWFFSVFRGRKHHNLVSHLSII